MLPGAGNTRISLQKPLNTHIHARVGVAHKNSTQQLMKKPHCTDLANITARPSPPAGPRSQQTPDSTGTATFAHQQAAVPTYASTNHEKE